MKKASPETQDVTQTRTKSPKEYLEVRIPKFSFRDKSSNVYLIVVLVIFSFLLGMLTNKVIYLEKASKTAGATNAAPTPDPATAQAAQPTPPQVVNVSAGKLPILGDANAKVTVVEFSDFQCPFCERFFTNTYKQINDTYIKTGKIKFSYRHYPLSSIHPNAEKAAEASECANEQDKFWEYHNILFQNQATWSPLSATDVAGSFTDYAGQLGLNTDQFKTCLDSGKYKKNVADDLAAGQKVQVDGTPAFFINGYRVIGAVPFADLQKVIETELKK
jgi:protein-disulfide isomerase